MSKLLQKAFERAKSLPEARQEEVGELVLALIEQDESDLRLLPTQMDEVKRRRARPEKPVSEQEARAFLDKLA